ncbi:MAG: biotin--[acetyl-CoA-carboxylase] ligase [Bryobacteraceae bacterium]
MTLDLDRVRATLPGRRIEWHATIATTMTEAARLARELCPSGTAVGADEQTAGRGRHGRSWHSPPGTGLYVSVVLRLPFPAETFPALTLAAGLAVRDSIRTTGGLTCDLRWPNDVLAGERKVAGILTQIEAGAAVVGIGVNVSQKRFPPGLATPATSLLLEAGRLVEREALLVELLQALDAWVLRAGTEGGRRLIDEFSRSSSYVQGKRVTADAGLRGVTDGLDDDGFLWIRKDDGERVRILAGGVRPL